MMQPEFAEFYLNNRWAILPIEPFGKHPVNFETRGGEYYTQASKDPRIVKSWLERYPDSNIGVATGGTSGVFVLDIDGEEGEQSLDFLQTKHGRLPKTSTVLTGRGRHMYFRNVPIIENSVGQIAPKIDIRGEEGYVVAPPSIHKSGRQYRWESFGDVSHAPKWLLDMIVKLPKRPLFPGDRMGR